MDISVTKNCIHIKDSWEVSKKDFRFWLTDAVVVCPDYPTRSIRGMELEWAGHNLLYRLHIARSRTADVDLESPQPLLWRMVWSVVGGIAWIIIP